MLSKTLFALVASLSTASAVHQGFNYGATNADGSYRSQADFQDAFEAAKSLVGTSGFTSARLYTMLQADTTGPTSAIPAAIASDTTLLLGLWASGGAAGVTAEINALKQAISQYDLYRNSPTGIAAKAGYGANPDELVNYIKQVKEAIAGTSLSGASLGHVDTWTAWVNGSNSAVAEALDWVGMDAYPYFQDQEPKGNAASEGKSLFNVALAATQSATGKDVWVTETGWPVTGATTGQAVADTASAKTYWDDVGCPNFGKINMYWYTLQDQNAAGSVSPSFGIVGSSLSSKPLFDLSCSNTTSSSTSTTSASATSGLASSLASAASAGAVVSSGAGLSPDKGSGAAGAAYPTGTGSAGSASGSNGTYSASTLRSASGPSATGTAGGNGTTSSTLPQSTGGAASLTDLLLLPLELSLPFAAALRIMDIGFCFSLRHFW
ncbi:hypothetical protein EYC84_001348 [Monilinia fructicola]|uniref:Probable glucan endo-1,3-beta-glucosidase eglC n=1 Tax=Monilinia fructicola TaxID=38448 RepID=A0A5M9JM00_MONFR|nr:hypothetical protein EYC84_001348 [Monilinia fructicola]